jgi:2-iminobutanoate/2-iminopropanoate deaminase
MTRRRSINSIEGFHHGEMPIPVASIVDNVLYSGAISGYDQGIPGFVEGEEAQIRLVFVYIRRVLEAADAKPEDVVRMTFYVNTKEARDVINQEWCKLFPDLDSRPARHTMTHDFPPNKHLMCDLVAVLDE